MSRLSRRGLLAAGASSVAAFHTPSDAQQTNAFRPVPTKDGFTTLSPDEASQVLIDGNKAFLAGEDSDPPNGVQRRLELAKGQSPFCA